MPIPDREADGEFATFNDWVCNATRRIGGENALCVDTQNRICNIGGDFHRARDEGTFPIRYFFNAGCLTPAEQKRSADLTDKVLHPYRSPALRKSIKKAFS